MAAEPGTTPPTGEAVTSLLPYGLGAAAILAVTLWVAQKFFGKVFEELGTRSAGGIARYVRSSNPLAERHIRRYRKALMKQYGTHPLGFVETRTVDVRQVYVPLQFESQGRRADVYDRVRQEGRVVVVGAPGAGKSLLVKSSMLRWADRQRVGESRIPVLIELHRCNASPATFPDLILQELARSGVRTDIIGLERLLHGRHLTLLFDGLDEVARDDQDRVTRQLKDFSREYPGCQMLVTSRDAVYHGQLLPEFPTTVVVADFDDVSVRRLLRNWPGMTEPGMERLLQDLRKSPELMRLSANPLMLTMIAYLHTEVFARSQRSLPTSRAAFYDVAVQHLLRRDRDLARHGALSTYDEGDKRAVLQRVALALQEAPIEQSDRRSISRTNLIKVVKGLLPDLNLDLTHATDLIDEIVDRSQLLVKLDRNSNRYAFRHLTLQEYLAAAELADDPTGLLDRYLADRNGWRETMKLWCGVVNRDSTGVISEIISDDRTRGGTLALECLAEAKRVGDEFARSVISYYLSQLDEPDTERDHGLILAFAAVAADARPRGRYVLQALMAAAAAQPPSVTATKALAASRLPEAARMLAQLRSHAGAARLALVSMGDQAVQALQQQAEQGDLAAVDDLGQIGTPSAAEALTAILWLDGAAASRAAWWLAMLVGDREVEDNLRELRTPARVPVHDWVSVPFKQDSDDFASLLGRVAYLLDNPVVVGFPMLPHHLDVRVGVPVGLVRTFEADALPEGHLLVPNALVAAVLELFGAKAPHSRIDRFRTKYFEADEMLRFREEPSWNRFGDLLRVLAVYIDPRFDYRLTLDAGLRELLAATYDALGMAAQRATVLRAMSTAAQVGAARVLCTTRAGRSDWTALKDPVRSTERLEKQLEAVLLAAIVAVAGWLYLGVGWAIAGQGLAGVPWPYGLGVASVTAILLILAADSVANRSGWLGDAAKTLLKPVVWLENRGNTLIPVALYVVATVLVPVALVMVEWLGPLVSGGVAAALVVVVSSYAVVIGRRRRASRNPLRGLMLLDGRSTYRDATVVG